MVDKAAEGAVGTSFELSVERGKIAELARATLSENPAYFLRDRAISPPTFLTTMFFWQERVESSDPWSKVKMDQRRGMHAEQEYVFFGPPPRAGDELVGQSRIASIYEKSGRRGGTLTFAVMVTEFRDRAGKLVAEARMTGVETGKAAESSGSGSGTVTGSGSGSGAVSGAVTVTGSGSGSGVMAGPAVLVVGPITRTDVVRYQGASGDMNPVHHDEPFALAAGYAAPLVVGMFQAGVLASFAVDWLGAENIRSYKVRWKEPVWPGDTLSFSGKIARTVQEGDETRVEVELQCTRQTGGVAVQGWATFVLPPG